MERRALVVDANILIRAVLGQRVRRVLEGHAESISFCCSEDHGRTGDFESEARKRLGGRDEDDWPILASALALRCPIRTEDTDFFGCGVATWTSGSIGIFLAQ